MPFGISQQQIDCDTWATVKEETNGTYTTIGCHATKQDAIDQMVVVSMSEGIDPLGEIRLSDIVIIEPVEELSIVEERTSDTSDDVVSVDKVTTMQATVQWIPKQVDESRSVAYSNLEFRAVGEGNTLIGYAAIFDSPSEPLPWIEYVRRGAFTKTINDGADVRLLIDHEGVPLARSKSGTLSLMEDDRGLRVEAELDPTNPDAARIMSAMRRGDISQMSFAFRTIKDSWNMDRTSRELREVQLFDVSVVTFPAYEATVAELRNSKEDATVTPSTSLLLRQNQIKIQRHR